MIVGSVTSARDPARGGTELHRVGADWEGVIPQSEGGLDQVLAKFLRDALSAAGYAVATTGDVAGATARLDAIVDEMWCQGPSEDITRAALRLRLRAVDPATGQVRREVSLADDASGASLSCRWLWRTLLDRALASAQTLLSQPELHAALLGANTANDAVAAPAPALVPSANGACPQGQTVTEDTAGHCCWAGQIYVPSRRACVGAPQWCPPHHRIDPDRCTPDPAH